MTRKVIRVKADTGIRAAYFLMREHGIRHLPVISDDDDNKLLGIISDRELRRPNWADEAPDLGHTYQMDDHLSVGDVMITSVFTLHTYDTLNKAVKLLLEHKIGAAPVLDKDENLVGMLSSVDLLQALNDIIENQKKQR